MKLHEFETNVRDVIEEIIKEDKITRYELALATGLSMNVIYRISRGEAGNERTTTVKVLETLIRKTGRNWAWLDTFAALKLREINEREAEEARRKAKEEEKKRKA